MARWVTSTWWISTHKEDLSEDQIRQRAAETAARAGERVTLVVHALRRFYLAAGCFAGVHLCGRDRRYRQRSLLYAGIQTA